MGIKWVRAQTLNELARRSNAGFHLAATTQNTPKDCAPFLVLGDADYRGAFRGYKNSRDTDGKRDREMEGERADTEEDGTGISIPGSCWNLRRRFLECKCLCQLSRHRPNEHGSADGGRQTRLLVVWTTSVSFLRGFWKPAESDVCQSCFHLIVLVICFTSETVCVAAGQKAGGWVGVCKTPRARTLFPCLRRMFDDAFLWSDNSHNTFFPQTQSIVLPCEIKLLILWKATQWRWQMLSALVSLHPSVLICKKSTPRLFWLWVRTAVNMDDDTHCTYCATFIFLTGLFFASGPSSCFIPWFRCHLRPEDFLFFSTFASMERKESLCWLLAK